jgi:hypothetical protein
MDYAIDNITKDKIEVQKQKVLGAHPEVLLKSPCKVGEGILQLSPQVKQYLTKIFEKESFSSCFFIPASGSGSRMFQFLFDFLEQPNEENRGEVEKFLNHITDFAFFQQLPIDVRKKLETHDIDLDDFVSFLLKGHGMGYGDLPKGLIPFHKTGPFILNPFQEQVLQGVRVRNEDVRFHFTVQSKFETAIKNSVLHTQGLTSQSYDVSFSDQDSTTNSYAFTASGESFCDENGRMLDRPAGHGALLSNLNKIDSDLIFIKNIDNVQHFSKSNDSVDVWKLLGGMIIDFKKEAKKLYQNPTIEGLQVLNKRFQLYEPSTIKGLSVGEIRDLLNRPTRVCGMVRNEGQPGGGPFWVDDNGHVSKQIIEKAQITMRGEQYRLMVQSTYFNPVMIVCSIKGVDNEKFDLMKYSDESKFFVVNKKYRGQDIRFIELPGLWNGSMAYWNSLFVEIPSESFTPVKTVLDLLDNSHK